MTAPIRYAAFLQNKNGFFAKYSNNKPISNQLLDEIDNEAKALSYESLMRDQIALEAEFNQLFAVLKKTKNTNHPVNWLFYYNCASQLASFYKPYSHKESEKKYNQLLADLRAKLVPQQPLSPCRGQDKPFFDVLLNTCSDEVDSLLSTPFRSSKQRDLISLVNRSRLYWIFCRLALVNSLNLAKELQLIDKLDAWLGIHTDVDKIISISQIPAHVLTYLSVGLFLMRFVIDAGTTVKHVFFPNKLAQNATSNKYDRFIYEFHKRKFNFANDLVWALVNFLTNFNHISKIPGPVAAAMTAVFLGFDVAMVLYALDSAKKEYTDKKQQYQQELDEYREKLQGLDEKSPEFIAYQRRIDLTSMQLQELEVDWKTKQAKFCFIAAAASLLMLGFTSALLFSPPGMVIASYFVCTLAAAMYFSIGAYTAYKEKDFSLRQMQPSDDGFVLAAREYQAARNEFIFTLSKNTIVPSLLISAYAICWPAAIALTVLYLGYELTHAYLKHRNDQETALIAQGATIAPA